MALIRLFVVAFLVLSVVYLCLLLYLRAARRERLERRWDEEIREGDREAFVSEGLRIAGGSLRRKLILGVYLVPAAIAGAVVYVVNYM